MADASEFSGPNEASTIPTEDTYARWARSLGATDALIASTQSFDPPDLKVTANGSSSISVAPGEANVGGVFYRNSLALTRAVPPNTGSTTRADAVVLRLNNTLNEVSVQYLKGTSVLPALARVFGVTWDLLIATVTVPAGASTVAPAAVADRRQFLTPGQLTMATGLASNSMAPGQLQARAGRLRMAGEDGLPVDIFPEPDPVFIRLSYRAFTHVRDYDDGAGSGYAYGAYARFSTNIVQLRGVIEADGSAVTNANPFAVLPAGFRPSSARIFCCWGSAGATRITITSDGGITAENGMTSSGWLSLDGINFWASN